MRRDSPGTKGGGPARLSQTRTPPAWATCGCFFFLLMCCPVSYAADPARVNRAHIGDPLKANEGIPVSPSADMLPGEGRVWTVQVGYGDLLRLLKAQSDVGAAHENHIQALAAWSTLRLQLAAAIGNLGLDDIDKAGHRSHSTT